MVELNKASIKQIKDELARRERELVFNFSSTIEDTYNTVNEKLTYDPECGDFMLKAVFVASEITYTRISKDVALNLADFIRSHVGPRAAE